MITEDQTEVVEFLASPATHGGAAVERIDTHSAVIVLAEERAWKLKRAVRFDYLDFSTPERRRACCEAEVRLNKRTAPMLYRGVVAITRERDGSLALGGSGAPVDWLVEMNRFDQAALFDRLAASGHLEIDLMSPLAAAIAQFHAAAEPRADHGGKAGMEWVIDGNADSFAEYGPGVLDPVMFAQLTDVSRAELGRHAGLLDARRAAGFVRQCHGDLHLRNIVLLDGRPTLFDAVEFNDDIACIDVLYDLAFLLMDLWRRQLPRHANAVWNRYLTEADAFDVLALMPLFLSCRAAVRAKTSATTARFQQDATRARQLQELAREYLVMAERLLRPPGPCLIAVGGLAGTGKSTLARALAHAVGAVPGAVVLRSDEIRKRLFGTTPLERLGPEAYTPEVSARVYARVAEQARLVVGTGHSAIADAMFSRLDERQAIARVAADAAVPFVGLWLDAPPSVLTQRVQRRRGDASDADADVVRRQQTQDVGSIDWQRLDASCASESVQRNALRHLQREVADRMNSAAVEVP